MEIKKNVGEENILIFGMTTPEVEALKAQNYQPLRYYESDPEIHAAIDALYQGIGGSTFGEIANSLKNSDPYMAVSYTHLDVYKRQP